MRGDEDYREMVENYEELIDESYQTVLDFYGYSAEAQKESFSKDDPEYLHAALSKVSSQVEDVIGAKEKMNEMARQLEIEEVNDLQDFMRYHTFNQSYDFDDEGKYAIAEAMFRNGEKLEKIDQLYFASCDVNADMGNMSFKLSI